VSDRAKLQYSVSGEGDPLVLIMGLGADRRAWELHLDAYQAGFTCFAVDNRGAGDSPRPEGPYTTAAMADDYAALIEELGLGRVRVVGISMGGAIAQELALRHPRLVERMVLVSTWACCDLYTQDVFRHFAAMHAAASPAEFARLLQLWLWTPEYANTHREALEDARRAPAVMPHGAFAAQCAACIGHDTVDRLALIDAPTLLTVGDRDIFTPLPLSETLHDRIPGAELKVFPGAGHAHHWEQLEQFNRTTLEWLG
jgi:pimeloyl-ACP methyl ester carboxylesterase